MEHTELFATVRRFLFDQDADYVAARLSLDTIEAQGETLAVENERLKLQIEQLQRQREHEYYEHSPSYFQMVKHFHEKYGLHIQDEPIDFSHENDDIKDVGLFHLRYSLHTEEWKELEEAWFGEDLVALADAICDLIYVLCGTAVSFGIPLDKCFAEVQRSNMSKLDASGNPIVREDGKILKGTAFSPPDLRSIIYGQKG